VAGCFPVGVRGERTVTGLQAVSEAAVPGGRGERVVGQLGGIRARVLEHLEGPRVPAPARSRREIGLDELGDDVVAHAPQPTGLHQQRLAGEACRGFASCCWRQLGHGAEAGQRRRSIEDRGGTEQVGGVGTGRGGASQHQ
jgi:hypothetical protein